MQAQRSTFRIENFGQHVVTLEPMELKKEYKKKKIRIKSLITVFARPFRPMSESIIKYSW